MLLKDFFNPQTPLKFTLNHQAVIYAHGLEGWILEQKRIELSPELKVFCQQEAVKYILRYEVFSRELSRFLQHFPSAIPLKGMSLIPRLYKNPILRRVTDIDLYYSQDLTLVKKYFMDQGFAIHEDKWEGNEFKLNASKLIDDVEVPFEIHQKLLWENNCHWEITTPEDELLYLSGHLAYQHTFLRANWLFDIALLISESASWDNSRLDKQLALLNLNNAFSSCLWACEHFLDLQLPASLQKYILRDAKNRLIQKLINDDFLLTVSDHRCRYYLLKHLLKDSLTQSLNYDFLWLKQKLKI